MIEEVGEDVVSVTLDTGNIVSRGEEPIAATKRVAPYIKLLHVKDVLLLESPEGLKRNVRPAGDGVLDFQTMADIVREKNPEALFNIEDHMGDMFISYKRKKYGNWNVSQDSPMKRLPPEILCLRKYMKK